MEEESPFLLPSCSWDPFLWIWSSPACAHFTSLLAISLVVYSNLGCNYWPQLHKKGSICQGLSRGEKKQTNKQKTLQPTKPVPSHGLWQLNTVLPQAAGRNSPCLFKDVPHRVHAAFCSLAAKPGWDKARVCNVSQALLTDWVSTKALLLVLTGLSLLP